MNYLVVQKLVSWYSKQMGCPQRYLEMAWNYYINLEQTKLVIRLMLITRVTMDWTVVIIIAKRSLVAIAKVMQCIVAVAEGMTSFISIAMARLLDWNTIMAVH